MTIVVMFGILDKFGLPGNKSFPGIGDDQFVLVEDRIYSDTEFLGELPRGQGSTPLSVLLHSSNPDSHPSQQKLLERMGYTPHPYFFSHIDGGELYEKIKSWVATSPSPAAVGELVSQYGNIVKLDLLDQLAAWNQLALLGDKIAEAERDRIENLVSVFAPEFGPNKLGLSEIDCEDWLPLLEEKARQYC